MILLENIIDEDTLNQIRCEYYPRIRNGSITGYNISKEKRIITDSFKLSYLHSDLKPKDKHLIELLKRLESAANNKNINHIINSMKIEERYATCIIEKDWSNPVGSRYFDLAIREIPDYKNSNHPIVRECMEYSLELIIRDLKDLNWFLDFFRKNTSKYQLDKIGNIKVRNKLELENKDAIIKSWEIPLTTINNQNKILKRRDFELVNEFFCYETISGIDIKISGIVSKSKIDEEFHQKFKIGEVFVPRLFYQYLNIRRA